MRTLTDHIVENDSANHQLKIQVSDLPGAGGANHRYEIRGFDKGFGNPYENSILPGIVVLFQNGPIQEAGVNGVTHEALLAILIDRLRSFQAGPYACRDNAIALTHLEEALMWLKNRTRNRLERGVEGTHKA